MLAAHKAILEESDSLPLADATRGARRLVSALLLQCCLEANGGDVGALLWLHSDDAQCWAGLLGLTDWPPTAEQLAVANRRALQRVVRESV